MYVTSPVQFHNGATRFDLAAAADEFSGTASHVHTFGAGKTVFHEGDNAEFIYEILEGVVRSSKMLVDGRRQVLSFGYPGDMIGLSHDEFYHSDCDAVAPVKVRVFRKNAFSGAMESDPAFCAHLLRTAAAEVNSMQEHFLMLGRKSAMEKIASFLITLLDRQSAEREDANSFALPMKRADIADFLGLTIETVSRTLTVLRKKGIIELPTAQKVHVLKPLALRDLAESDL
ncbi:MAG: helix-turn-helix domain-containing protein [Pseudomonadota bacterium]